MNVLQQPVEQKPVPLTLRVTWPFIVMVLLLAACATASLQVLSGVRAFVVETVELAGPELVEGSRPLMIDRWQRVSTSSTSAAGA